MIKYNIHRPIGSIVLPSQTEGELLETKIMRIMTNNEPIQDGAPIVYMDRKEGVNPAYDVRTDRFDMALDAMDIVAKSKAAKREERAKESSKEQPVQGTEPTDKPAA